MTHISSMLRFLGQIPMQEPLGLDRLTIGPMGQTTVLAGDKSLTKSEYASLFQNIQVQPTILRVDMFPVCSSPVFSPRLTVLHFFAPDKSLFKYELDSLEWHKILSATPNLVELRLWHPVHGDTTPLPSQTRRIYLPSLRQLELTGLFVGLSGLFVRSPLSSLKGVLLDSLDPCNKMPEQIADIASVSPSLSDLSIGSMIFCSENPSSKRWAEPLQALESLESLRFFEMEWDEVAAVLERLSLLGTRGPVRVRLERIHDIKLDELARVENKGPITSVELVDCVDGMGGRCNSPDAGPQHECQSEAGNGSN
ncbi:hypothetical protein FRC08_016409, partial [Ceratobasidium sp. 394]